MAKATSNAEKATPTAKKGTESVKKETKKKSAKVSADVTEQAELEENVIGTAEDLVKLIVVAVGETVLDD